MSTQQGITEGKIQLGNTGSICRPTVFPVDLSSFLTLPHRTFDAVGACFDVKGYHSATIAQHALVDWNQFLANDYENDRDMFLTKARWLIEHEVRIGNDAGGWPISSPHPYVRDGRLWLSALVQGNVLSVLVRAYQLTGEEIFLEVARRAVRTFEQDILDGGISTPIGEDGVFFEEVAVYPAAHILSGFLFALIGLYDYVAVTADTQVKLLVQRGMATMLILLDEFDTGFWTRSDLLHRYLSSPAHLTLQIMLLEALATYSDCEQYSVLASRWKSYQCQLRFRLRHLIISSCNFLGRTLLRRMRSILFPRPLASSVLRVCVPITAFPVTGGMRTILAKMVQVTSDIWQMEYLTQSIGPDSESFVIHRFGTARKSPWEFPNLWLYCFAGLRKLFSLIRQGANYEVILPQDGIYTGAFAALVAKWAGLRVVCIDHGNLVALMSRIYRSEYLHALPTKPWRRAIMKRLLFLGYWPSVYMLAWLATHLVDHFCVPGVVGDGVEEICRRFGVGPSRLTRFVNTVDIDNYIVLDTASRAEMREKNGIPADAIVITTICRLSPEKGLDIALEAMSSALLALSPALRSRVRFIIAGDGILRKQIEEDIYKHGLNQTCVLWGEIPSEKVLLLHSLSDIYLYTGIRGGGYSLVMTEAMASGCAVVASAEPIANVRMLAEGRGMIVPVGDAQQTALALIRLVSDADLRAQMGCLARDYIALHNTDPAFRRVWLRATYWSGLNKLLRSGMANEE